MCALSGAGQTNIATNFSEFYEAKLQFGAARKKEQLLAGTSV
jgi:hypothetical protein